MPIIQETIEDGGVTYYLISYSDGVKKVLFSGDQESLEDAKVAAIAAMDAKIAYLDATVAEIDNLAAAYQGAPDGTNESGGVTYNVYTANGKTYHVPQGEEAEVLTALGERKTNIGLAKTQLGAWKTEINNLV